MKHTYFLFVILFTLILCILIAKSSTYPPGNAWDDITLNGISYEQAWWEGWGDAWMSEANSIGTDPTPQT